MHTTTESTEAGDLPRLNSPSIEYTVEDKQGEADGGGYSSLSGFTTGFPNALAGPRRSIGRTSKKKISPGKAGGFSQTGEALEY